MVSESTCLQLYVNLTVIASSLCTKLKRIMPYEGAYEKAGNGNEMETGN